MTRVQSAVYSLTQSGELSRRITIANPKERAAKIADAKNFRERVKELSLQGLTSIQISVALKESLRRTHFIMWELNKDDEIQLTPEQMRRVDLVGYVDKYANTPTGDHYNKVAEMREQGMNNGEIASVLNLPKHRVEIYASNLIRAGIIQVFPTKNRATGIRGLVDPNYVVPNHPDFQRVAELRNQGLNNTQIVEQLGLTPKRVSEIAHKLIKGGVIKPLRGTKDSVSAERRREIQAKVAELRNQGMRNPEISTTLNVPINSLTWIVHELINSGAIKPQVKRVSKKHDIDSSNEAKSLSRVPL